MRFLREDENSLLWLAGTCRGGAVKRLIDAGCDVNEQDEDGRTALLVAAGGDCVEVVKILVKGGANVNTTDDHGQSPLTFAVANQNFECVKILLEHGAIIDQEPRYGISILEAARKWSFRIGTERSEIIFNIPRLRKSKILKILEKYKKIQAGK